MLFHELTNTTERGNGGHMIGKEELSTEKNYIDQ